MLRILFNYFRMVLQSVDHQSDAYIYHDIVILLLIDVHSFLALSVCSFVLQSKRFMIPQTTMVKQCSLDDIFFSQFSGQLEVFISLVIQTSDICIVNNCDNKFNCCLSPCVCTHSSNCMLFISCWFHRAQEEIIYNVYIIVVRF